MASRPCFLSWSSYHFRHSLKNTAPTALYTLSLHDALPISPIARRRVAAEAVHFAALLRQIAPPCCAGATGRCNLPRSEEHTSELQSLTNLVCRLLLEKKKKSEERPSCYDRLI